MRTEVVKCCRKWIVRRSDRSMRSDRCGNALFRHSYTCIVAECKCVITNNKSPYDNEDQHCIFFLKNPFHAYITSS